MKDGSDQDWKAAWKKLPGSPAGPCPPPETLSAFVGETLEASRKDAFLNHLAACPACREDVAAARIPDAPAAPAALRLRLYRLLPGRTAIVPRFALAAAVLLALLSAVLVYWPREQEPSKPVVVLPPKPAPKERVPSPEPQPGIPVPIPEQPKLAPTPELPPPAVPEPVKPLTPAPEPPKVPAPVPAPVKPVVPAPAPEKPAPEPTRVAMKGSVLSIAGSCSSQLEGDAAAQALRPGQKRAFAGMLRLKADAAAAKVAVGGVTCYLQRGSELSLLLEEGRSKVQLAKGEAFFDVSPGQSQFVVETAQARVIVKGTRFLVSADKSETGVVLQKGAVDFSAADQTVSLSPGEQSAAAGRGPSTPQKADLSKRLGWVRTLEDSILIDADQMVLQGGMTILPDPTALGGRAIGIKAPLKPGQDALAEIPGKRKQAVPYTVWIRLHWFHGVPSALSLSVGDALTWSSKGVGASPNWQWVRVGVTELDERFRVRLSDTQPGLRVDQILITSDPELHPENK